MRGATEAQKRVVRLVQRDLKVLGVVLPKISLSFADARLDEDDLAGYFWVLGDHAIDLRPTLTGGQLYATLAHEYGHALGLGHTASGLMSAHDGAGGGPRRLTLRNRRKWMRQLLRGLHDKKLRELQQ